LRLPIDGEMSVDYRLLAHFEASRSRHETARGALPEHWRNDPRPEVQTINESWVDVFVRATEACDLLGGSESARTSVFSVDDR
jgi:hypothetical protein